jgi:hypothetical protein
MWWLRICGGGGAGYVVGKIKIKLSPAGAGTWAELGNIHQVSMHIFLFLKDKQNFFIIYLKYSRFGGYYLKVSMMPGCYYLV